MNKNILIIILLSIISCNDVGVTKTEIDAVQQVLNFYNGKIHRKKDFIVGTKNETYFIIEIEDSELLEKSTEKLDYHSANIAYLFYTNLKNEKNNYDGVKVKIKLTNGNSYDFEYSDNEIIEIEKLKQTFEKISKILIKEEYQKLVNFFEDSIEMTFNPENNIFKNLDNEFGKVLKTQFQGFKNIETKNFGNLISLNMVTLREKANLIIKLNFKKDTKKLIEMNFE